MKTKTVGTLLIAGLVVLSAMVVFATPAMAAEWTEDDLNNAIEMTEDELADVYEAPPSEMCPDVDPIWYGHITNNGDPLPGVTVILYKYAYIPTLGWTWVILGYDTTSETGFYNIWNPFVCPPGSYLMRISDGSSIEYHYKDLTWDDYTPWWNPYVYAFWSCEWNQISDIPEFATIALPAASILGLLFFFNHRKRRKE